MQRNQLLTKKILKSETGNGKVKTVFLVNVKIDALELPGISRT